MTFTFRIILPVLFFIVALIVDKPFPDFLPGFTSSELGLVENLQALFLLLAFGIACYLLKNSKPYPKWIKGWIGLGMVGSLYVFLEEISYGQHYFNWNTPEYWLAYNDQQETNFHNMSSWLDQKPRLVLEIGIVVGGIIVPILRHLKPAYIPQFSKPILPTDGLFIIALLAILPRLYERITDAMGHPELGQIFVRVSEMQELYFYYFILLYFIALKPQLEKYHLPART